MEAQTRIRRQRMLGEGEKKKAPPTLCGIADAFFPEAGEDTTEAQDEADDDDVLYGSSFVSVERAAERRTSKVLE